jgi:FGGY-family pentulose kinase
LPPELYLIGVDVGTQSARAGVFSRKGDMIARAEFPIALHRPMPDHVEHDSEDIWHAVCAAVRAARERAEIGPAEIAGISFDAACSLVVRGLEDEQLCVSTTGEGRWDTIVWLDHRAVIEAEECTATRHRVLDFIGGTMSPEMETPKLMWLKRNLPETWVRAGKFFDLADFLTWKASGSSARSQCTLTCKWTYLAHESQGWRRDFFDSLGISDLIEAGALPLSATDIGADLGALTIAAARELGLTTHCRVGAGLIDAHAGALGVFGADASQEIDRHAALIAGTSTCIMALSREPRPVKGVWGPYFGAVLPGLWLNEGGQSATGALLDHLVRCHSAGGEPDAKLHQSIIERVIALRHIEGRNFAHRLQVLPDFHGNRSPLADAHALGVISGLSLDSSFDSLCGLYWRTAVGIALGVRHILAALNENGYAIDTLHVTGGHTKNPLLMELYADATGCIVMEGRGQDAVLLGSAMAAAKAAGFYADLPAAMAKMAHIGESRRPDPHGRRHYDLEYAAFLAMHEHRRALDDILLQDGFRS